MVVWYHTTFARPSHLCGRRPGAFLPRRTQSKGSNHGPPLFILHPCRSRTLVVPTIRRRKVPSFPGQLQYQAHQVVDKEVRVPRVHGHLVAQVCHSCLLTPIVSPFVDPSPSAKSSLPTCAKSIQVNFHSIHSLRFRIVEEKQYDGRNQDF